MAVQLEQQIGIGEGEANKPVSFFAQSVGDGRSHEPSGLKIVVATYTVETLRVSLNARA